MFQPFTLRGANGGFSRLNNPATTSGAITCIDGEGWVRFLGPNDTLVTASGPNADITDPGDGNFVDGWIWLEKGVSVPFGAPRFWSNAGVRSVDDPVAQLDFWCADATIIVNQN